MEFNRKTYQYFVSDNFKKVKDYLSKGVFDRYEEWLKCASKKNNTPITFRKYANGDVKVGDVVRSKDGGMSICVGIHEELCVPEEDCFWTKEILSNYVKKPMQYYFSLLKKEESRFNGEVYSYSNINKEKRYVIKIYVEKNKANYYCPDFHIDLNPSDSDIWDSFFTLYSIIGSASTEKKRWSAASIDFEECVKIVNGQIANPLRFLLSLGDQHMQYIFYAFKIENECYGYVNQNLKDNEKAKDVTFKDRIEYLDTICSKHIGDEKLLRNCREILNLIHLRRSIRNSEGHQEETWSDPGGMMKKYLMDYVMIVYMIKHILKFELRIPRNFMDSMKETLYYPVTVEEGLIVEDAPCIDNQHYFIEAFKKYIVEDEKNNVSIELEITSLNEVAGLEIRSLNGKICIDNTAVLELINRIEYNPILESMQKQIADIRGSIITQYDVRKIIEDKMPQFFSYVDSKIADDLKDNNESVLLAKEELSRVKKDLNDNMDEISSRLSDLENHVKEHEQHLQVHDTEIEGLRIGISELNEGQEAIISDLKKENEATRESKENLKKRIRRITIYIAVVVAVLLSGVVGWFVFHNDFLKKHYAKKAEQELILARDCEKDKDFENAAIHNKIAFDNTLKAFQIDTTDHNLRRRLIYMYQWGKGTPENHEEALKLAIPIKDDSPKNFGRYIYLRYITDPKDTLNVFSEIKRKEFNNTDSSVQEFLQDSLVRLTKAVIGLSFANNEQDEDEFLSHIKDFDAAGMYEAKWEMTKFMLRQKKLFESGKSVHFMPAETLNNLRTIAWGLNYGEAWKELGNICDIFEVNDLASIAYKNAILAGKEELYLNYAFSNYELWRKLNDTIYEKAYKEYMQKAAENGNSVARMLIALDDKDIKYRDKALLENKAAPQFSAYIARELLSRNPSPSTMNTILQLLHRNGRNDVTLSYLYAHKAFYEGNRLKYISLMQQAWDDSCFSAYLCLGDYCTYIKEYDNARYYYNKVKEKTSNDTIRSLAYDMLLNLALVEGDTISFNQNTPNASLIWKLNAGHYKDDPEYIITECQNLLFSDSNSLNEKGVMAFLIGNAYEHLENHSLAMDWYELAAQTLHQTWVFGPLLALTRYMEKKAAFETFKDIEGYDLSAKMDWSLEEMDELKYIYKNVIPKHLLVDGSSGEFHEVVPYALSKWSEDILKNKELPDKYKTALLWLAHDTDLFYGSSVENDLNDFGLDTNISVEDVDLNEVVSNLTDITAPRLLPDYNPRCIEF